MAIPIAPTPELSGKEAAAFIKSMYENAKNPVGVIATPKLDQAVQIIRKNASTKK